MSNEKNNMYVYLTFWKPCVDKKYFLDKIVWRENAFEMHSGCYL